MAEAFVFGVIDVLIDDETNELYLIGKGRGKIMAKNAVYLRNCGEEAAPVISVVKEVLAEGENGFVPVSQAKDGLLALKMEELPNFTFKKSTVVYTHEATDKEVHDTYIASLGDSFVIKSDMDINEAEFNSLSITDLCEIWRLNNWYHAKDNNLETEEKKKTNLERVSKLCACLCKKLLSVDEIYCVFSKITGEPFLYSKTVKGPDGFMCTSPNVRLLPKAYYELYKDAYPEDKFELRIISNGENKNGINSFLGECFYVNGAQGVEIISDLVSLNSKILVAPPDFSDMDPLKAPIFNPDVERWLLLIGQLDEPKTEDEKTIHGLYFGFLAESLLNAKLILPILPDNPPEGDDHILELKSGDGIKIASQIGLNGENIVRLYTDWKQVRYSYGPEWGGMLQTIEEVIEKNDVLININKKYRASCYINKELFEQIKENHEKIIQNR